VSGARQDLKVKARRRLVRAALCVAYAGLMALMFALGKGHTLLLDNQDAEDGSVKAQDSLTVSVDGQDPIDLAAGDRDQAKIQGQGHRVEITLKDGTKVQKRITVPVNEDLLLLSLPKLLAGAEHAVIRFVPKDAPPPTADQGNSNAFTSPDAPLAPVAPPAP
jgi:hypothetical protein